MLNKKELGIPWYVEADQDSISILGTQYYIKDGSDDFVLLKSKEVADFIILAANQHHAMIDVCDMLEKAIPLLQKNALDNCDCDFEVPKITLCEHCKLSYDASVALFMATGRSIDSGEALLATHTQEEGKDNKPTTLERFNDPEAER